MILHNTGSLSSFLKRHLIESFSTGLNPDLKHRLVNILFTFLYTTNLFTILNRPYKDTKNEVIHFYMENNHYQDYLTWNQLQDEKREAKILEDEMYPSRDFDPNDMDSVITHGDHLSTRSNQNGTVGVVRLPYDEDLLDFDLLGIQG
jgi:hypothetical protein